LDSNPDQPARRTALIAAELARYNVDIAALSETRFPDDGSLMEVGGGTPSSGKVSQKLHRDSMVLALRSAQTFCASYQKHQLA